MNSSVTNRLRCAAPALFWLLATLSVTGCHQFDLSRGIPWETRREKQKELVTKVASTWIDAIRQQADHPPTRGFGGRLYFYGKDQDKPIHVEGRIVVYGFDETDRGPANPVPNRKFVFPADEVPKLCSESPIGPSYSVWLPWDNVGGEQKRISLIVRFQPDKGPVVVGKQVTTLLPGREPIATPAASPAGAVAAARSQGPLDGGTQSPPAAGHAGQSVQTAAYTPQQVAPAPKPRMQTTTIPIGPRSIRSRRGQVPPPATLRNQKDEIRRLMEQMQLRGQAGEAKAESRPAGQTTPGAAQREVRSAPATPQAPASPVSPQPFGRTGWPRSRATSQLGQSPQPLQRFPGGTINLSGAAPSGSH